MSVPDFQSLMLPLLSLAGDGKEHSVSEARARLASEFRLSEGEQNELLPSGRQSRFGNRVAWAKVYLEQGGLLVGALHGKRAKKGVFITTGSFSSDALAYVEHIDPKVVLIDGRRLAEYMIDFEVGVTTARTFHVKRIDSDYFEEG